MPISPGYVDYVRDLFSRFGSVDIKRMFGGAGIYADGVMFALIDDDMVYIRTDADFAAELKAQGCRPWVYSMKRDGEVRDMGYWSLPEAAADDPDEAAGFARRALAAAKARAATRKPKTPPGKSVATKKK